MIARYAGATLGLLAFTVAAVSGLLVQNPVSVTLSRSMLALILFCVVGMVLGQAAQVVIREHEADRRSEIKRRFGERDVDRDVDGAGAESPTGERGAVRALGRSGRS